MIAATLDYDSLAAITVFTLTDDLTVTVMVTMTGTNGHTDACGTNTNTNFFRAGRHRNGNSSHRDGSHCKSLDHHFFLSMNLSETQFAVT